MEKRFVVFILLSSLVMVGYVGLQLVLGPKPKPVVEQPAEPGDDDPPADPEAEVEDDGAEPPQPAGTGAEPDKEPDAEVTPDATPPEVAAEPEQPDGQPWGATLGSFAKNDPDRIQATFSRVGATLENYALTERTPQGKLRYRDLETNAGYLGYLAPTEVAGGLRINIVGPGTPAATAIAADNAVSGGLQPDDVITELDGEPIRGEDAFREFLATTKPGDALGIRVMRPPATPQGSERSLDFTVTLDEQPLRMIHAEVDGESGERHPGSFLLSVTRIGQQRFDADNEPAILKTLRTGRWDLTKATDEEVEFTKVLTSEQMAAAGLSGSWKFVKRYRLPRLTNEQAAAAATAAYHVNFDIEIYNLGPEPQTLAYQLDGPNSLPLEGWWYSNKIHPRLFYSAGARDVIWSGEGRGHGLVGCSTIQKRAAKSPEAPKTPLYDANTPLPLHYVGVDCQYFCAVLRSRMPSGGDAEGSRLPPVMDYFQQADAVALGDVTAKLGREVRTTNVSFELTSYERRMDPVAADQPSVRDQFTVFAGPKQPEILAEYGLGECIEYGWFGLVARPLSAVLHFFSGLVGNYGLAIIMLTVLVRGCMFPISRKAAKNAKMMQDLAPEMKQITEKYKNDMEKRAQAQRELFAKNNYNPFGGCLLMFLQLPIFIGLYRSLSVDVELRQASLIPGLAWCSNLAGPDQLWRWSSMAPEFLEFLVAKTGWLGPYFNLLPIITIALFITQQKLFTPPPTDEQTRMQHQMMKFMMVFMGVLFFKVPSGLCIYFIASSLWGITERMLLPRGKPTPAQPQKKVPPARSVAQVAPAKSNNGPAKRSAKKKSKRR